MAQFLVRNSLNPYKVVKLGISFSKVVNKPEMTGDDKWVVEIGTVEPHLNGGVIAPVYLNMVSLDNIDEEISNAVKHISEQINWGDILEDNTPPFVSYTNVISSLMSIDSSIMLDLKEFLPSSGIDKSSIKLEVNDIDVTNELYISGNPYKYSISWYPRDRVRSTY